MLQPTVKPRIGSSKIVYEGYDVTAIFPDGDGAVAVIGLGHMGIDLGIVTSLDLGADGHWRHHEIARLPATSSESIQLSPGIYAARSGHRVTVFNRRQVLGLATCLSDMAKETAATAQ
jgi:hypothetical protein